MRILLPVVAAAMTLSACGSAPAIKYPSGSANRVAINNSPPITAAAVAAAAKPLSSGSTVTAVGRSVSKSTVVEPPPTPIPVSAFFVNASETSTLNVMRRWARAARVDFSWESSIDYPVTAAMREISTTDLQGAIVQMRKALEGVEEPLVIVVGDAGLVVSRAAPPEPVVAESVAVAGVAEPVSTASTATVVVAEVAPAASPIGAKGAHGPEAAQPTVVTAEAPAAAAPAAASRGRVVKAEKSLREVVASWTSLEGVELRWDSARDFPVDDNVRGATYDGDLRHALALLASKFGALNAPLGIRFLERGTVLRVYDLAEQS
ncbi:hypothetical protein J2W32_006488 [Variovorax boronicumulans]|uniref:Toxin co-regulated pilus biosynthesis protein Q C-terminal domain-containing protein n=1 Tax=Variovorax boronicumulans TaxID=436515 RepID=A0AAW8D459_9BURK|nr:TcpQ domain-containing protein [Variovorax boronicumulans]MDP9897355.1 hypothetical protein [Variovorax boronicumulans]MDQ0057411.1 hypothetical protein [Variovorax boronicumulans]